MESQLEGPLEVILSSLSDHKPPSLAWSLIDENRVSLQEAMVTKISGHVCLPEVSQEASAVGM